MEQSLNNFSFSYSTVTTFRSKVMQKVFNNLPHFKGSWLVYSPIFSLVPRRYRLVDMAILSNKVVVSDIVLDIRDPAQQNVVKNHFEPATALIIWSLLVKGDVFIDVGANFGIYGRIVSKKIGGSGKIIAIEPNPVPYQFLVEGRPENMETINKVSSNDANRAFRIHKPFYRQTTSGRFLPDEAGKIKSTRLDDLYKEYVESTIALIKIDTEGAEFLVLEGGQKLLKEKQPIVIAEVVPAYAKHFDYDVRQIYFLMKNLGYNNTYRIDEEALTLSKFDPQGFEEGQILFSPRALQKTDFNEILNVQ